MASLSLLRKPHRKSASVFKMAEQPNFNTLSASVTAASNGLAVAATETQKMQNILVVNLAAQMTRMEEHSTCASENVW